MALYKDNTQYYRNALVRSNYADRGIDIENKYLCDFYQNLLFQADNKLCNNDMLSSYCKEDEVD